MDGMSLWKACAAFICVLGLIGLFAFCARRFGLPRLLAGRMARRGRISIRDVCYIDPRHRLVLVRRDTVEHLLLIGVNGMLVVERGITPPATETEEPAHG